MIKLAYSNAEQRGDLSFVAPNLETDEGLETIVTVCLFTDARAKASDGIDDGTDRRGWWGSQYLDRSGDYGSRIWVLRRGGKLTRETLRLFAEYARESLLWLIDKGIASEVTASATRMAGPAGDVALLTVGIQRPRKSAPRFERAWEVQFGI